MPCAMPGLADVRSAYIRCPKPPVFRAAYHLYEDGSCCGPQGLRQHGRRRTVLDTFAAVG
jgi:hypothetical protein